MTRGGETRSLEVPRVREPAAAVACICGARAARSAVKRLTYRTWIAIICYTASGENDDGGDVDDYDDDLGVSGARLRWSSTIRCAL